MDLILLTPIEIEYRTIRGNLTNLKSEEKNGYFYETGRFQSKDHLYSIALRLCGSKNTDIALATEKAVQHWRPTMVWLTGVAGGVKDVEIGDLVVGTKAYGYESGKETPEGFVTRPEVYPYHNYLLEQAKSVALTKQWQKRLPDSTFLPKVVFGPIASGNKVIASTTSPVYHLLKHRFNDTIALEMESVGFAKAMSSYPQIPIMNIRGISDLLDDKKQTDAEGGQEKAMNSVTAFIFEFLYQLNFSNIQKYSTMDVKTLAQQIVDLLFPLLKLDTIQQDGQEFKEVTHKNIQKMWKKVKQMFIEEIELEDEEEETKMAIRRSLRKKLKKDDKLKNDLAGLLKKAEEKGLIDSESIAISNSKNVISGSNIKVGGNFHLGDTTNNIGQQVNNHGKVGKQINIEKNKGGIHM